MIYALVIILSLLAVAAVWLLGWFFAFSLVLKVVLTVGIVGFGAVLVLIVLVLRMQRAKSMERDLLQQGDRQVANTRPERREGILELQRGMQNAIGALKSSRLGGRGGTSALYALPWYIIVGPPGAGKTTALRHSGLVFPLDDAKSPSAYRGIGGTRNCDWWFTNDAILLDTAGRYSTDANDAPEWLAFLDLLKKYRPQKPINGLLVALSLADVAWATDAQVEEIARRLRARIDEIATHLKLSVPVYVVLTKSDLVEGFVEFWGDLRRSERGQLWGATLPLALPMNEEPAFAFGREFDGLVKTLHARTIKRLASERHGAVREKIAQFPLEFAAIRHPLGMLLSTLFQRNRFQETPTLRGVYFSSGTQTGKPTARVLAGMAQAFGLRLPQVDAQAQVEPKSFFLTDVFQRVIFRDQSLAAVTDSERRRRLLVRGAIAAVTAFFAASVVLPAFFTFLRNRELVHATAAATTEVEAVPWSDGSSVDKGHPALTTAETLLTQLRGWNKEGAPLQLRWGMYSGKPLEEGLRGVYEGALARAFVTRAHTELETRLKAVEAGPARSAETFNREFDLLKLYLMLSEPKHLDPDWAAPRLVRIYTETAHNRASDEEAVLVPHAAYYLRLLVDEGTSPWKEDAPLVTRVRSILAQVPQLERVYESLVRDADVEIAPVRREAIFYGSVAPFMQSRRGVKVSGAYTKAGWGRVRVLLGDEESKLAGERWILGDDSGGGGASREMIDTLRNLYFERFKNAWRDFLLDLQVQDPGNASLALDELNALSEPEWPYQRLARVLRDNVTLDVDDADGNGGTDGGLVDKAKEEAMKLLDGSAGTKKKTVSSVERAFRPILKFGVPPEGAAEDAPVQTGLAQYQALLAKLVASLTDLRDSESSDTKGAAAGFEDAFRATGALLSEQDGFTRPLLSPLLMGPITLAWGSVVKDGVGGLSALWQSQVWQKWHDKLEGKYPFTTSNTDASAQDFLDFFHPGDGVLWSFYDTSFKNTLARSGDDFIPARTMRSTINYTPELLGNCLKRGSSITDALFGGKGDAGVSFDVNVHSVSSNIAEVTFEVEGVSHSYRNEPERWMTAVWPGKATHGAKLRVRGAGGLDEEIARPGDFGLFRLLDAADVKTGTAGGRADGPATLVATWELRASTPPATVKLDFKPTREQTPLAPGYFRGYSCPREITSH